MTAFLNILRALLILPQIAGIPMFPGRYEGFSAAF
jgi:hypothetical protein